MGAHRDCQTIDVAAPPEVCFAALTDYERLPEWQGALREARVLERDDAGAATVVEFVVDAKVKSVRYTLRQEPEPPHRLGSSYVEGDFRGFDGEWRFEPSGSGTRVELDLAIDPGRFVPGPVRALIRDAVMRRALQDLKAHVEAGRLAAA